MRSSVRLEPLLAARAKNVPDDAEHRREELVAGRGADDLMEANILVGVRLPRGDLPLLRDEQVAELREVRVADPRRGERRDRRLDDAAELDHVLQRVTACDEGVQRAGKIVGRDLAHECAAASARLDNTEELERPERFAHRRARDLELLGERALRGKLVPGAELALLEERLDLLDDALVEPRTPDRLDRGQGADLPVESALVRWSDQPER